VAFLVDTNVLVYRFDPRFPEKQRTASELLRAGVVEDFQHGRHYGTVRIRNPFA
jgi:predicted nucleic acid-binding protein